MVGAKGLHDLSCRESAPLQIRYAHMIDLKKVQYPTVKKSQYRTVKEAAGLARTDGKRPDGATLIPSTRGKPLAWDITIPDTCARSYIDDTAARATAAAGEQQQTDSKIHGIKHDASLHSDCNRDGRCMESTSYPICQRARQKDDRGDERTTRDLVLTSETINCVTERILRSRSEIHAQPRSNLFNSRHVISRAPTN